MLFSWLKVSDLVDSNQEWNIGILNNVFDRETIEDITIPPRIYHGEDACLWKETHNGIF